MEIGHGTSEDGVALLYSPSFAGIEERYAYDLNGNLTSVTDPLQNTTTYEYDHLGRTTKVTSPDADGNSSTTGDTPSETCDYDAQGNLHSVTDALGHAIALSAVALPAPLSGSCISS